MSTLTKTDRRWLEEKFGARANFGRAERVLYGHDIAAIPSLFKPLVGDTVPDAVVQPESEEELIEPRAGRREKWIPLVPRGKGSSGYGGIIPIKKGDRRRFLQDEKRCCRRRRKRDGHRRAGNHLGTARPRPPTARPDASPLSDELSFLVGRRLAGPGRRRHRILRLRLVCG